MSLASFVSDYDEGPKTPTRITSSRPSRNISIPLQPLSNTIRSIKSSSSSMTLQQPSKTQDQLSDNITSSGLPYQAENIPPLSNHKTLILDSGNAKLSPFDFMQSAQFEIENDSNHISLPPTIIDPSPFSSPTRISVKLNDNFDEAINYPLDMKVESENLSVSVNPIALDLIDDPVDESNLDFIEKSSSHSEVQVLPLGQRVVEHSNLLQPIFKHSLDSEIEETSQLILEKEKSPLSTVLDALLPWIEEGKMRRVLAGFFPPKVITTDSIHREMLTTPSLLRKYAKKVWLVLWMLEIMKRLAIKARNASNQVYSTSPHTFPFSNNTFEFQSVMLLAYDTLQRHCVQSLPHWMSKIVHPSLSAPILLVNQPIPNNNNSLGLVLNSAYTLFKMLSLTQIGLYATLSMLELGGNQHACIPNKSNKRKSSRFIFTPTQTSSSEGEAGILNNSVEGEGCRGCNLTTHVSRNLEDEVGHLIGKKNGESLISMIGELAMGSGKAILVGFGIAALINLSHI